MNRTEDERPFLIGQLSWPVVCCEGGDRKSAMRQFLDWLRGRFDRDELLIVEHLKNQRAGHILSVLFIVLPLAGLLALCWNNIREWVLLMAFVAQAEPSFRQLLTMVLVAAMCCVGPIAWLSLRIVCSSIRMAALPKEMTVSVDARGIELTDNRGMTQSKTWSDLVDVRRSTGARKLVEIEFRDESLIRCIGLSMRTEAVLLLAMLRHSPDHGQRILRAYRRRIRVAVYVAVVSVVAFVCGQLLLSACPVNMTDDLHHRSAVLLFGSIALCGPLVGMVLWHGESRCLLSKSVFEHLSGA